jgi:hypothetical protein
MLTQSELKEIIHYDTETGLITWGKTPGQRKTTGAIAGTKDPRGHIVVCINWKRYKAHRLAWLYMTGEFPEDGLRLDHINRIPSDNRWCNLRLATAKQNSHNAVHRVPKESGVTGVYPSGNKLRWTAKTTVDGKAVTIGTYDTIKEAHDAYVKHTSSLRGEFFAEQSIEIKELPKPTLTSKNLEQTKTLLAMFNIFRVTTSLPPEKQLEETRYCKDCGREVSVSLFTQNTAMKSGYAFYCKEHSALRQKAWKKENKEKVRLAKKQYYARTKNQ